MPPEVDLESINSDDSGDSNDFRITAAEDGAGDDDAGLVPDDFPPESFWLSKDAEYDWLYRNAFYERKDSTKGNSNSIGNGLNRTLNPSSNSNSQRFPVSLKSKASIIGLPKTQKNTFLDSKRRSCRSVKVKLFPKRSDSAGKSVVPMFDPGSPNVSCTGRVRSKRGRRRSNAVKEKQTERSRSGREKKKKGGLYSKVISMFRSKKGHRKPSRSASRKVAEEEEVQRMSLSVKGRQITVSGVEPVTVIPGLGEANRFASGRRSVS